MEEVQQCFFWSQLVLFGFKRLCSDSCKDIIWISHYRQCLLCVLVFMFQTNTPVTYRRHWTHHELAALPRGCLMHVSLGVRVGGLYLNASVCFDTSFTRKLANAAWKWIYTLPRSVWAFEVCTQELFSFSFTYMNIRHVNLDASSYVQVYFYVQSFTADSLKIRSGLLCRLAEGCSTAAVTR